jgi:glycosyltransferase involved in cell wall biosynthesis
MIWEGKICYVVSHVEKSLGFEWISRRLKDRYDLSFILLNPDDSPLEQFLKDQGISVTRIRYSGKSDFIGAFLKTFRILRSVKPDAIHVHLLDAQLIALTAARILGVKKRIYTRHNSNFHHVYHPRGVWYDRWSNMLSTHIVSISQATDHTLTALENVPQSKVRNIPHGFDFDELVNVHQDRVTHVRSKWNIPAGRKVIGVVARHIEWKGIQYIIPAFAKLKRDHPDAVLVLANASGPYRKTVDDLLKQHDVTAVVVPFEEDVAALYRTFTVYVHTPVDALAEAFGQAYVEALAIGIPSVFSLSGISAEFITDGENALTVPFRDSEAIQVAIGRLLTDDSLKERLIKRGKEDVFSRFGIAKMIALLEKLYDE